MPHLYKDVEGWFTFSSIYDEMVAKYHDQENAKFIEIGCWFGRSSVYMLEKLKEYKSKVNVFFVDTWLGGKDEPEEELVKSKGRDYVYLQFLDNIQKVKDGPWCQVNRMDSLSAANHCLLEFDFIFIDAGHRNWQCYDDIVAWYPKLKPGGTIAGHDINFIDVQRSVKRFCRENNLTYHHMGAPIECWRIDK